MGKAGIAIEWRDPKDLKPYGRNAKAHPREQVAEIADKITRFGFDVPIVVDRQGVVIKGHGRREAALLLDMTQVPVIVSRLDAKSARASRIADNKVGESAWINDVLRLEFQELAALGVELGSTGFSEEEAAAIIDGWSSAPGKSDPDGEDQGMMARVSVSCLLADRERVVKSIEGALRAAGIANTSVS